MEKMSDFWSLNEGTFYCLIDELRTEAFKKAIHNTVKPGDVVVELGAGSGVLSMFAADAGAKKVYAVELDYINAKTLRNSLITNNYHDVIEVLEADATAVDLPEKVDVVICEMIATGLIEELQVPAMNNIHRFTHETTKILLKQYNTNVSLVHDNNEYYGKKFEVVRFAFPDIPELDPKIMSNKSEICAVDFSAPITERFVSATHKLLVSENGCINGLMVAASTLFCDNSSFDASMAYSFPIVLPIPEQPVNKGDVFEVKIQYEMCGGPESLEYSVVKAS